MRRSSHIYHPHNFHKLKTIISNSWKLPFYQKLYSHLIVPKTVSSPEIFRRFPILTRKWLYDKHVAFTSPSSTHIMYLFTARVGTETNDIPLPLSRRDYEEYVKLEQYKFQSFGITPSDRGAVVAFSQNATIPMAQAIMAIGALYIPLDGDETEMFKNIIDQKVTFLFTVPQFLYRFMEYVYRRHEQTHLRLVITTGVAIPNNHQVRKRVKHILGAELMETIGSTELGTFAISCKSEPQCFHFLDNYHYVELVNPETNEVGSKGEIVITPLWKIDYPLLRYGTGDYVELTENTSCSCIHRSKWKFGGIERRTDNTIRIERYLMPLQEVYEKTVHYILHQYPFDTILWRFTTPPLVVLFVTRSNNKDTILLFIENTLFMRRTSRIIDHLASISSASSIRVIYCQKKLLQTISPKYQDLRDAVFSRLPKNVQNLIHSYKSFFL